MRCSIDLRKRVLEFVENGGSKSEAARRFTVSRASVYVWLNSKEALTYKLPGPKKPRKLDLEALRADVLEYPDKTQAERALHFNVSRYCIWKNLRRLKTSRKKNDSLHAA